MCTKRKLMESYKAPLFNQLDNNRSGFTWIQTVVCACRHLQEMVKLSKYQNNISFMENHKLTS